MAFFTHFVPNFDIFDSIKCWISYIGIGYIIAMIIVYIKIWHNINKKIIKSLC